jgi:hypothetical protein
MQGFIKIVDKTSGVVWVNVEHIILVTQVFASKTTVFCSEGVECETSMPATEIMELIKGAM